MKKVTKPIIAGVSVFFLVGALSATSLYFYTQYKKSQTLLQNPTEATKAEMKSVTAEIGKIMELPSGEEPSIATVLDKEKLKDQPFYARSENGDKIIIYAQAKKAILYRPSVKKIIDVAPINIDQTATPLIIALYNGTESAGQTNDLEKILKEKVSNIVVAAKENAKKNTYPKTLVIDLAGTRSNEAGQLAQFLNGEVSKLPAGEEKPEGAGKPIDILIIIGKDFSPASLQTQSQTPANTPAPATPLASPATQP